jgi:hypothetical protein
VRCKITVAVFLTLRWYLSVTAVLAAFIVVPRRIVAGVLSSQLLLCSNRD